MNEHHHQGLQALLLDAVLRGDSTSVRNLLAEGAHPNEKDGAYPLLMLAVLRDDVPTARLLLEAGANVQTRAFTGYAACQRGSVITACLQRAKRYRRYGLPDVGKAAVFARPIQLVRSAAMAELLIHEEASSENASPEKTIANPCSQGV